VKTYESLRTPQTSDEIEATRLLGLQGISHVTQSGGASGLGDGTGSIVLSGIPVFDASVVIKIFAAGEPGDAVASYQLSTNGGVTYGSAILIPATPSSLGSTGLVIAFVAAPDGSSPSFFAGDLYSIALMIPVFDATAWQDKSVPKRLLGIECDAASDTSAKIAALASGAYLRDAAGGWVDLHARDVFDEARLAAVFAEGQIVLSDDAGVGPVTISAGSLWIGPSSGALRYSNLDGGTLPLNGELALTWRAESAGSAWNAPNGSLTQMLTPIAGVSCLNSSRVDAVVKSRPASPTITAALIGSLTGDYSVKVEIQTSGALGVGTFRYSLDAGLTWAASSVTLPALGLYTLGTTGLQLTFAAGSYLSGDSYTFDCSISWLSQAGVDRESDDRVKARCSSKWATLAVATPADAWTKWAEDASPEVLKVLPRASLTVAGQTEVWLAGAAGAVSAGVALIVDAALQPHAPLCTTLLTQSVTTLSIALVGTVYCRAGKIGAAQANAYAALAAYQLATPIGGNLVGGIGIVSLDVILGCLTGGANASLVEDVNLSAPAADVTVGSTQAPIFDTTALVWVEV
jgi:hypothetical protein